jgi:hypothetical protein
MVTWTYPEVRKADSTSAGVGSRRRGIARAVIYVGKYKH